jgi:Na+/H+-dicarboxylate symporter
VLCALLLGVLTGFLLHKFVPDAATVAAVAGHLTIVSDIFLRLIKLIIAPLVFATLVSGIAHMQGAGAVGRIGAKTLLWFLGASVVSLIIGLVAVQLLKPGAGLSLHVVREAAAPLGASALTLRDFVAHLVPASFVDAMARNEILQIVVFSVLVGLAMVALGPRVAGVLAVIEQIAAIMLKITGYVVALAPFAVFATIAATVALQGIGILAAYAKFIAAF